MTAAIPHSTTGHHQWIPLKQLAPSPLNHRKTFNKEKMEELAASIRVQGVIQPILARPLAGEKFEVVAGERRYRAAKTAGLVDIPAIVRELTDAQALELQVIENGQRVDPHPLEEAEGYEALMHCKRPDGTTYSAEEIAAKVGKSKAYVYARLKLTALGKKARDAFYAETLDASRALLLARIPVQELQDKALEEILEDQWGEGVMSYRDAADHIQSTYMLRLADAPFKTGDAELLAKAGACTACPKRTGNQPELFGDVKSADFCTDPECFSAKKGAHVIKLREAAVAKGQEVIAGKDAKKVMPSEHGGLKGYRALDEAVWVDNKQKTIKSILGKDCPPAKLLENPHTGTLMEVVPEADVKDLLKAKLPKEDRAASTSNDWQKAEKARKEKAQRETKFRERIHARLRETVVGGVTRQELAAGLAAFYEDIWHEHRVRVARLWDVEGKETKRDATTDFTKRILELPEAELSRLLVDLAVIKATYVAPYQESKPDRLYALAKGRGINVDKERAAFNAEHKEADAAKKKKKKKAGKK